VEVQVPEGLVARIVAREGEAGRRWAAGLPDLVRAYLSAWDLRPDGPTLHGYSALIVPVRDPDGEPAMLKLGWPDGDTKAEPIALETWAGRGAVRLLARDDDNGVLLLERLGTSLQDHPDATEAAAIAGEVMAALHAVRAPEGIPSDTAERQLEELPRLWHQLGKPFPERTLSAALEGYAAMRDGNALLHGDLHFANVLSSTRAGWLAIDPIPLAGEPGYEILPLLRNRTDEGGLLRRFDAIVEAARLDRERAVRCTLARAADDALWFRAHDRPAEAEIADHLLTTLAEQT
jgi:streptomycin 6-kinase